jgi:dTDP-4-amino-4,6-dideoxygalactose transaminase
VRYLGADPVFADIDFETLNIDPAAIEKAITPRTKAIVPVHFAGLPCDMDAILDIAKRHGLKVVEDAAHALPTCYHGKLIGSLESDATVFSFYATNTITTGEGGMVVTKNPDVAKRCKVMRLHVISRDAFGRYVSNRPAWQYEVVAPGFKYNMTDIAASIGIHQLRKAHHFRARRVQMAARYNDALKELPLRCPPGAMEGVEHAWHLYVIRLDDNGPIRRDTFIENMSEMGIGCSVHFIPLHLHPYWRDAYHLQPEDFPEALKVFQRAVSLPLYTRMTDKDQEQVIEAVKRILI